MVCDMKKVRVVSYQNSGCESKNGLDCNDVLSRLGIIATASSCIMWNMLYGCRLDSCSSMRNQSKGVSFSPTMEFYTNQRGQKCAVESGMYFIILMSYLSFQGVGQTFSSSCLLCFR